MQSRCAQPIQVRHRKPGVKLNVRDFGATGDGKTKDTAALQQTIDRAYVLGGGEVLVPAGNYFIGAIALKSNVLLRLEKDAVILGTPDFADYPVTQVRWEGKWIQGHLGLIYAIDAEHIGVIGPGKIIGNPALGGRPNAQNPLRHPALIEPIGCRDVRFENFSTEYTRMWSLHPTYSDNLVFKNLTIRSTGGNGDGIDIDSCRHVLIDSCDIATGDDCIAIKSGRGMEAYQLLITTEEVLITNCTLADRSSRALGLAARPRVVFATCAYSIVNSLTHRRLPSTSRAGRAAALSSKTFRQMIWMCPEWLVDFSVSTFSAAAYRIRRRSPATKAFQRLRTSGFQTYALRTCRCWLTESRSTRTSRCQGFSLINVAGTAAKGITLANVVGAKIQNIQVTGFTGPLISINNVSGTGLKGAVRIDPPKLPEPVK